MDDLVGQLQFPLLNTVLIIICIDREKDILIYYKKSKVTFFNYVILKFIIIDRYGGEYDNEKDKGPGWTTVPSNEFTKFTMKRSPAKKFLESGATVIYINTKVFSCDYHPA